LLILQEGLNLIPSARRANLHVIPQPREKLLICWAFCQQKLSEVL